MEGSKVGREERRKKRIMESRKGRREEWRKNRMMT